MIEEEEIRKILRLIIDSYHYEEGCGLPMGNQTSQWFAVWYLNSLDRLVKEKYRIKYYTRYMDDFILVHEDKNYLREVLAAMEEHIHTLGLEFNAKTQIYSIKNGVDYLGYHFYLTDTGKVIKKLRTSSKKRIKRKLKEKQGKYRKGELSLEDITPVVASYKGHLKHGNTYYLQKKLWSEFVLTHSQVM